MQFNNVFNTKITYLSIKSTEQQCVFKAVLGINRTF